MSAVTLSSSSSVLGCQKHGHGPEKVLVFHDWMGDAANYEPLQPYLDREAFSYVFADLRGYGRSSPLAGEYTAGEAAGDAFALADALGWGRFHVVGHSMSGLIVQRMALDDWTRGERRLKSVVAITPVAADGYPADAPTRDFLWSLIGQRELSEQGFAALTGQRLSPIWARAKTERHLATSNPEAMRAYFDMWLATDFSAEVRAARIATPMLVIGGRNDLPGFQEEHLRRTFGAWYPQARFEFVTDAGHYPMQETPALLAALIERFVAGQR
jgi:pimeloyl-ACP methyl ester carboxylesterase